MAADPAPIAALSCFEPVAHVRALAPYRAPADDRPGAILLGSNENPLGPSPRAIEAAGRALSQGHRYPDAGGSALRDALASRLGVAPDEIALGAGSNELLHLLVRAFCRPGGEDEIVTHRYAFVGYRIAGRTHDVPVIEAAVRPDLGCDVDALVAAFGPRTRLVLLASPNNPTGAQLTRAELERVLVAAPRRALVIVDEAYHEYAAALDADYPASQPYRRDRPGLVTLRTFSKIYGLAGLRVGYAIADRRVVSCIDRIRRPFHVASVAQAAALAALDDTLHVTRSTAAAASALRTLTEGLTARGLAVYPSRGNFVLVDADARAAAIHERLLAQAIVTRPMDGWGLPGHLRISLGTEPEIQRLLDVLA